MSTIELNWEYPVCDFCGSDQRKKIVTSCDFDSKWDIDFTVYQCKSCDLIYVYPRPDMNQLLDYFYPQNYICYGRRDEKSQSLIQRFYSYRTNQPKLKVLSRYFARDDNNINVLDIGCSDGNLLKYLRNRTSWNLHGLEPNAKIISPDQGISIQSGFLEKSLYPEAFFDVIILSHVLEHVNNPYEVLSIAGEILKLGGILIIEIPNSDVMDRKLFGKYWWGYHLPRHLYQFTRKSLNSFCSRQNLKLIEYFPLIRFGQAAWSVQNIFRKKKIPEFLKQAFSYKNIFLQLAMIPLESLNYLLRNTNIILFVFKKQN